jgi:hypothetical protein
MRVGKPTLVRGSTRARATRVQRTTAAGTIMTTMTDLTHQSQNLKTGSLIPNPKPARHRKHRLRICKTSLQRPARTGSLTVRPLVKR